MQDLSHVAPAFMEMAHRIVWATVGTTDPAGRPRTRVLHPIWSWDGEALTGLVATDPTSAKRAHLDAHPFASVTYWHPDHDTCTADCATEWALDLESRQMLWDLFSSAPAPVGYDPAMIPGWDTPASPRFGVLVLRPWRLKVLPGSLLSGGTEGEVLMWRA